MKASGRIFDRFCRGQLPLLATPPARGTSNQPFDTTCRAPGKHLAALVPIQRHITDSSGRCGGCQSDIPCWLGNMTARHDASGQPGTRARANRAAAPCRDIRQTCPHGRQRRSLVNAGKRTGLAVAKAADFGGPRIADDLEPNEVLFLFRRLHDAKAGLIQEANREIIDDLFGLCSFPTAVYPGSEHNALRKGTLIYENMRGLLALAALSPSHTVVYSTHPLSAHNFVVSGSAASAALLRPLYNFDQHDVFARSPIPFKNGLWRTGDPYCYDFSQYAKSPRVKVYYNRTALEEPSWGLIDYRGSGTAYQAGPYVGGWHDGFLKEDWLLVKCIPRRDHTRMILVEGEHGAATASFPEVLANLDLLRELRQRIKDPTRGFAALLRLTRVNYSRRKGANLMWAGQDSIYVEDHCALTDVSSELDTILSSQQIYRPWVSAMSEERVLSQLSRSLGLSTSFRQLGPEIG